MIKEEYCEYENFTKRDYQAFSPVVKATYDSLIKMIIPSLREVHLTWYSKNKVAKVTFYHDGLESNSINEHYKQIIEKIKKHYLLHLVKTEIKFEIHYVAYPNKINSINVTDVVYSRKEPYTNQWDNFDG